MKAILLMLGLMVGAVAADGIRMTEDFHFVSKREGCYTMKLTVAQIAGLEGKREGDKKLYAKMKLTNEQVALVKAKSGKKVTEVLVFEKGWNDCGCCAQNIASRFAPDQIEVSNSYLVDEDEMRRWEEKRQAAIEAAEKRKAAAENLEK